MRVQFRPENPNSIKVDDILYQETLLVGIPSNCTLIENM